MTKSENNKEEKVSLENDDKIQENEQKKKESEPLKKETIEEKLNAVQDKLLRTMAEMENQRRRFEKEKQEAFDYGGFNFASESLLLLDNVERAIISFKNDQSLKDSKDLSKIIEGIEIVKKDLVSIFKKNGIEQIDCINEKFDPNFHQAMLEIESDTKNPGTVVEEIQKGYMMKNRLLRPSLVGVAKKMEKKEKKK